MSDAPRQVYMDNHSTTRVDPRVFEAMKPFFLQAYGNAGSVNHAFGDAARDAVERARETIANCIGAAANEVVFTSGATESNNLAVKGVAHSKRRRGDRMVSVVTEHKAMLDPLHKLERQGCTVEWLPVAPSSSPHAGMLDLESVSQALTPDTALVSVMLANNEIGVIQPLAEIARLCGTEGCLLHSDATQAVGRIPVAVDDLRVDLMSFSAHKLYGPKGIGALFVRKRGKRVRLESQIEGGGQEFGLRSGTLNVPGIVGFAEAIRIACDEMSQEAQRLLKLRQQLFDGLQNRIEGVSLNGPDWNRDGARLPGNLNCGFKGVEGESLLIALDGLAVSSGSACTSTNPAPSHVLKALGMDDDQVRSSLRFGLGRFNTDEDVDFAVDQLASTVAKLRGLTGP